MTTTRWRVERGGTTSHRLPGWFAVLTTSDGTITRCAHVPTFADAWSVVDLHTSSVLMLADVLVKRRG